MANQTTQKGAEKCALVTGASEGIGRGFAEQLARDGYQVTAVARTESKLKNLIQAIGSNHRYIVADLSTENGQDKIVQELRSRHYNLLVNNAGVGTVGRFTDVPVDKQRTMLRLNCEALMVLAHAFLEKATAGDALINVSSALAFMPLPSIGLYSATKAYVTSFSESLWYEYKSRGVYVMGLCPGATSTNFQVNAGGSMEDIPKNMMATTESVIQTAMTALAARRQPTVISGLQNTIMATIMRALPRKSTVNFMGGMAKKVLEEGTGSKTQPAGAKRA